jgi:DNA-binding MarR family transcriptional regulator
VHVTKDNDADRLHSLAVHLLRHARVDDAATGLSAPRLSVLSVLVFGGPRTVSRLAAAEQVAVPTMTKLLQALESEGYVRRRRDAEDGRVVQVSATARGRRALERGRARRGQHIAAVLAELRPAERTLVRGAVATLERALRAATAARSTDA